jgi:hypothetical protein
MTHKNNDIKTSLHKDMGDNAAITYNGIGVFSADTLRYTGIIW